MEAAAGAVWSAARGWLTPPALFLLVNLVIGAIAAASWLMSSSSSSSGAGVLARGVLSRAPSFAADRLRCFSFSRLGLADHHPAPPPSGSDGARDGEPSATPRAEEHSDEAPRNMGRSMSEPVEAPATARRRPRARRTRKPAGEEPAPSDEPAPVHVAAEKAAAAGAVDGEAEAGEVDARADDFIRRFREHLRLQRLDSMLRYRDTLRRAASDPAAT